MNYLAQDQAQVERRLASYYEDEMSAGTPVEARFETDGILLGDGLAVLAKVSRLLNGSGELSSGAIQRMALRGPGPL
jgi:hypothetical protein